MLNYVCIDVELCLHHNFKIGNPGIVCLDFDGPAEAGRMSRHLPDMDLLLLLLLLVKRFYNLDCASKTCKGELTRNSEVCQKNGLCPPQKQSQWFSVSTSLENNSLEHS